ncbi:virion structural protein [Pseudomonas phage Psa21]|uniref:Virion structural protein n=1 Tax=Pseudomonas phage Psa21 TaxID=2530023 RepID=A0A481W471_9CAUD|nr:virion structural protein [Pseudomonas phage Psa21]QBJ02549.1 virion structural protein [Pseudomonas phage Psa21]
MYRRCEKPAPNTTIDLSVYGNPCDIYQNMLNRIDALRRLKDQWPRCDFSRFDVQFQLSDAMTYMFVITDKANGEMYQWSVEKEFTKESAQHAFERDYNESALRYNSGVRRALDDHLEALQEDYAALLYRAEETDTGYRVWRPIVGPVGLVPFQLEFIGLPGVAVLPGVPREDIWDYIGNIPGEAGRAVARLVKRLIKLGVVFDSVERTVIKDYRSIVLEGYAWRNESTHTKVRMTMQEIAMLDKDLEQYHKLYTE